MSRNICHNSKIRDYSALALARQAGGQMAFARHIGVPLRWIKAIVRGKDEVTPDTAWRFAQAFGTPQDFWMELQFNDDPTRSRPAKVAERLQPIAG